VPAGSGGAATEPKFRTDIQGLRAVAVVLVVLNHAFDWPGGGFVGVDVFYVISGFLITGILLRELHQTGSISLRAFYARRIRRIVPAAILVLVVTVALAFLIWFLPRALQTLIDAVSAALFVSNWHFIATGTDYLQAGGAVSPVQHYWSLSIEEQFYAVWPIGLLFLFVLLRGSRKLLTIVVMAGILLSIGWAAYQTVTNPTAAYFDTFARAWELLAGALVALVGTASARLRKSARAVVSAIGVALIFMAAVMVGADWAVPFPGVLPSVLGAVLVVWAAAPAGDWSLLGNRVSQWLGDVSYSLYLWHFPVLVFAESIFGDSWQVSLGCIPVMLILSELSRRYVEQAFLRGPVLAKAAQLKNSHPLVARDLLAGVAVLGIICVLSVAQLRGPGPLRSATSLAASIGVERVKSTVQGETLAQREAELALAVDATAWPGRVASELDTLYALQQPDAMLSKAPGCRNNVEQTTPTNICGEGGEREAMVVGDSVALSWFPTVQRVGAERGWNVTGVGFANCSLFDIDVTNRTGEDSFRAACAERRIEMQNLIADRSPEVVVLSASETALGYTGLSELAAAAEWQAGVTRTLTLLADVPLVVILTNPPMTADPTECAARITSPASCLSKVSSGYVAKATAEKVAAAGLKNVVFIDTQSWFCRRGACPAFIQSGVLRTDTSHITEASAVGVAPLLSAALEASGG
jgi:peptidoglycan/LPS O-acetylase OafA/YrhL